MVGWSLVMLRTRHPDGRIDLGAQLKAEHNSQGCRRLDPNGLACSRQEVNTHAMSALGHERTFKRGSGMSASSPRADVPSAWGGREDLCVHALSCALSVRHRRHEK